MEQGEPRTRPGDTRGRGARRALVTGASAGIGSAIARRLARDGCDLVLTARRADRLEALAHEIRSELGVAVDIVPADLLEPSEVERLHAALGDRGVDILVNNAGFGVSSEFGDTPWKVHAAFLQVMVGAVVHLTHLCLPAMKERGFGQIVQVASLAGLLPGSPTNTLYAGAKAFLIRFSESLAAELAGTGVHVMALCPGLTHSEFHDVMGNRETLRWAPASAWQTADEVAEESVRALRKGAVVHVTGSTNRAVAWAMRHLPPALARGVFAQRPTQPAEDRT